MELVFLLLTIFGIIIALIFGYLQVVVPFIKGEVRFSRRFPFVETAEAALAAKQRIKRKKKRKRFLIPILAIGILIVIFVLIRFLVFQAKAIERVPIAVINFTNRTGDEQFDYLCEAIPNLLITNLEQSKHLSVLTWERMRDLLKIMGKEDVRAVDEDLGFEICKMDDIEAVITGSFTKAGNMFVTEVKVLNVATKKILKTSSSQGEGIASILKIQIDELSSDIAKSVSLYERVAAPTEMRIMNVTTSSMDAYNYYRRGKKEFEKFYHEDARIFLEKAIKLDSTFAMAHFTLALVYLYKQEPEAMREHFEKAMRFSNKATERERLWIKGRYARVIEDDYDEWMLYLKKLIKRYPKEKGAHFYLGLIYSAKEMYDEAVEEYEKELKIDPGATTVWNDIAYIYAFLGQYDKAIECAEKYAFGHPGDANPFDSMGRIYFLMGELDKALAKFKEAVEVKNDFHHAYDAIAYCYALKENYGEALKWIEELIAVASSPGIKAEGHWWRGFYHYWLGQYDKCFIDLQKSEELYEEVANKAEISYIDMTRGWLYLDKHNMDQSQTSFENCFAYRLQDTKYIPYNTTYYYFCLGFVELKRNNIDSAKVTLTEMESLLSEIEGALKERIINRHKILNAEILLVEGFPEKVITSGEEALPLRAIDITRVYAYIRYSLNYNLPFHKDLLAHAYYAKGDLDKAIAEYERIIVFDPRSRDRRLIHPKYHYRLGIMYEEKGVKAKAVAEYEKFLEFWKDADADRPELIDAKKRLAKLKGIS